MAVSYRPFQGARVSRRWLRVLTAASKTVRFRVNSGHRTMAQQRQLFIQNMHQVAGRWVPRPGRPLTAVPSATAPHIRVGRAAHAIDVDVYAGDGVAGLAAWLREHGATPRFPVPGEAWHLELTGRDLARLHRKLRRQQRQAKRRRRLQRQGKLASTGHMSKPGIERLIREEGLVPYAYNDPAGHATFGVGHLLHLGPVTDADRRRWGTPAKPKPRANAIHLLREDLEVFERTVRETIKVPLRQHEFDALVSLAFNIGAAAFAASTVAKRLNHGDRKGAADAFLMWKRPPILLPRRRRERNLFRKGHR